MTAHLPEIVIKANQKHEVANYGLSLSYDIKTKVTTAFLYGCHVTTQCTIYKRNKHPELSPQLGQLCDEINAMSDLWSHPLVLPVALLVNHFNRLAYRANVVLDTKILKLEKALGQTWAGRLRSGCTAFSQSDRFTQELKISDAAFTLPDFTSITKKLNTTLTELIQINRCAAWELEVIAFLKDILKDSRYTPALNQLSEDQRRQVEETLEYMTYSVKAISARIAELRARAETQLEVVRTL